MTEPMLYAFEPGGKIYHLVDCVQIQTQMTRGKYAARCTAEEGKRFGYTLCRICATRGQLDAEGKVLTQALKETFGIDATKEDLDKFVFHLNVGGRKVGYLGTREKREFAAAQANTPCSCRWGEGYIPHGKHCPRCQGLLF